MRIFSKYDFFGRGVKISEEDLAPILTKMVKQYLGSVIDKEFRHHHSSKVCI